MFRIQTLGNCFLLVIAGALALSAGCTQGTSTTGAGPSGIQAFTLTLSSIKVTWTRDPTDTTTDTVVVMSGTTIVTEVPAAYPLDSAIVTGLMSGTPYKIFIATKAGHSGSINYTLYLAQIPTNLTVVSIVANSATVSWTRFATDTSADTIIVTTPTGQLVETIVVPVGASTGTINGLAAGGTYVVIIATTTGRSSPITVSIVGTAINLSVDALSSSSIGVKWSRSHGDTTADTIVAIQNGSIAATLAVMDTSGIVTNLQEGVLTYISVHSFTGISDTVPWMTAERTSGLSFYEIDDNSDPNELVLATNGTKTTASMSSPITGLVLALDSTSSSGLTLQDSSSNNAWDTIKIKSPGVFIKGGLMNDYRNVSYTADTGLDTSHSYRLSSGNFDSTGSLVIEFKTASGHFGLIEIVPDTITGQLYSVAPSGKKFITMNVSYESAINQPYAGRGRRATIHTKRITAH